MAEKVIEVSSGEIEELRVALKNSDLSERFKTLLSRMIDKIVANQSSSKEQRAATKRLQRMLFGKSEKLFQTASQKNVKAKENHGRLSVDEYNISEIKHYSLEECKKGDTCPCCQHGTLQQYESGKKIRLVASPLVQAELHQTDKLRCSGCGEIFSAQLPEEVEESKADASAKAMVAIMHYSAGMPFYRLANIQKSLGVPLPPSNQYEMCEDLSQQVAAVYNELLKLAANGSLMFIDDSWAKILAFEKAKPQLKAQGERVGIYTTGIVSQYDAHKIMLYFTGNKHAGENFDKLLAKRNEELEAPIQMSDALSRNLPQDFRTIPTYCLVHARRNFIDCLESYTDESKFVIDGFADIYKNEHQAIENNLEPKARLEFHQKHSKPIMDDIFAYAKSQLETKAVEPNSMIGGAFKYLLKYQKELYGFCEVEGAPLDNNTAERALKKIILLRKNSMFFKTEDGAKVADILMSVIFTANQAGTNVFDYLVTLQKNAKSVTNNPHLWLPWNYKKMLPASNQVKDKDTTCPP